MVGDGWWGCRWWVVVGVIVGLGWLVVVGWWWVVSDSWWVAGDRWWGFRCWREKYPRLFFF